MTAPQTVVIYTDGACHGNPGPGGWGAVVRLGEHEQQLYGGERGTTNNRMELMAAIAALESIASERRPIQLWTDSQYVRTGITTWIAGWKRKGWKTAAGQPVKNVDLWQRLDAAAAQCNVDWRWVKGHAGHEGNELADQLANRGAVEFGGSTGAAGPPRPSSGGARGRRPRRGTHTGAARR